MKTISAPGLPVEFAATDRLVQAQAGTGVGAGDEQEILALACLDGHLDLQRHLLGGDDAAARGMAALLRHFLVLELDGGHACRLIAHDRVAHVQQAAVARIGIADHRRVAAMGEAAHARDHIGIGGDARIRHSEIGSNGAVARGIERMEAHTVRQAGGDHVEDAGGDDELLRRDGGLQAGIGHG